MEDLKSIAQYRNCKKPPSMFLKSSAIFGGAISCQLTTTPGHLKCLSVCLSLSNNTGLEHKTTFPTSQESSFIKSASSFYVLNCSAVEQGMEHEFQSSDYQASAGTLCL